MLSTLVWLLGSQIDRDGGWRWGFLLTDGCVAWEAGVEGETGFVGVGGWGGIGTVGVVVGLGFGYGSVTGRLRLW